jgi:hypothetical protein
MTIKRQWRFVAHSGNYEVYLSPEYSSTKSIYQKEEFHLLFEREEARFKNATTT